MIAPVTIGNATLYLGDCREILPTLGKVDAVVTDPPYALGDKWRGDFKGKKGRARLWGVEPPWDHLERDRLLKALDLAREAIVWGGQLYELPSRPCWLAWDKCQTFSSSDFELAWTSMGGANRVFRMSRIDAHQNIGETKQHPTQKPTPLMQWCISFLSDARMILDPFMGSGTTGVAAVKMGRKFIGIELDPKYFDIACKRVQATVDTPDLFVKQEAPATQLGWDDMWAPSLHESNPEFKR